MIDSTIVHAHPCAAGAVKKGGQAQHAVGRSRGGFSTKIHINVDALGNPLRFILTAGQRHDSPQAKPLLDGYTFDHVLADKGYDSDALRHWIAACDAETVIPPRANRTEQYAYDAHLVQRTASD